MRFTTTLVVLLYDFKMQLVLLLNWLGNGGLPWSAGDAGSAMWSHLTLKPLLIFK
jgi:hypothetical protein